MSYKAKWERAQAEQEAQQIELVRLREAVDSLEAELASLAAENELLYDKLEVEHAWATAADR